MGYDKTSLKKIYDKTSGYCHLCNKKLSFTNYNVSGAKGAWHVDHSKPKANGGTNHGNNLFAAHITCNKEKGVLHKNVIRKKKGYHKNNANEQGGCFITTACVRSKGLPDNCYELETLRGFRDNYVAKLPCGEQILQEYYKYAPIIVSKINSENNATEIYNVLFRNEISKSVSLIKDGRHKEAFDIYSSTFLRLKNFFLPK